MSNEGMPDDRQIGEVLLIRVVLDQMRSITERAKFSLPFLPEVQALTNVHHQKLVEQLAQSVNMISKQLDQNEMINGLIDHLARLRDEMIFPKLAEEIFSDGKISWGRIIVLYYAVGKLAVKMVLANLPRECSGILHSCLDLFRAKLLVWIRNMGGWTSSISALIQFAIECKSASSLWITPLPAAFIIGILLGGVIVWKFNSSS